MKFQERLKFTITRQSDEIAKDLANVKALAVLDRADSCSGTFAPVYSDVVSAMYANGVTGPKTENYVYGLGGREIDMTHIADVFKHLDEVAKGKAQASKTVEYINVRIK